MLLTTPLTASTVLVVPAAATVDKITFSASSPAMSLSGSRSIKAVSFTVVDTAASIPSVPVSSAITTPDLLAPSTTSAIKDPLRSYISSTASPNVPLNIVDSNACDPSANIPTIRALLRPTLNDSVPAYSPA